VDSTGRELSFGETLTASLLLKKWIAANCAQSQCIGLLFPASVGGALVNLAVTLAGKTSVNLNFTTGENAMKHAIQACGIETILTSRAFLEKAKLTELPGLVYLEDLQPGFTPFQKFIAMSAARTLPSSRLAARVEPDDMAAIIFSSGSTGTPKGVMLSHWNLIANGEATAQVYSVGSHDCMLGVLPFFHSFGYTYTLWFPLLHVIGELAGKHHPTLFLSTPTFCLSYLRKCAREQLSSIRYLLVGAEKLRPALASSFEEKFGVTPLEGYGCTEMGPAVSVNAGDKDRGGYEAGTVGRPLPHVSIRIVHPETFEPLAARTAAGKRSQPDARISERSGTNGPRAALGLLRHRRPGVYRRPWVHPRRRPAVALQQDRRRNGAAPEDRRGAGGVDRRGALRGDRGP